MRAKYVRVGFDEPLYRRVNELAEEDGRSRSNAVKKLVAEAFEERDRELAAWEAQEPEAE